MKVRLVPCLTCEEEKPEPSYWLGGIELRDELVFNAACPHGHESAFVWNAQKFEVLFNLGASALLDGYGREAVSTFAAAQERFHEFAIKVFLTKQSITRERFLATWRHVANQSERQLGAYYLLYLVQFNSVPPVDRGSVEFRNKVIHKGYIPTLDEATDYAQYVYDYILDALRSMKPELNGQIEQVCDADLQEILRSLQPNVKVRVAAAPTMIWLLAPEERFGARTFREALRAHREEHRDELQNRLDEFDEEDQDDVG
jgi:hypothetical protein